MDSDKSVSSSQEEVAVIKNKYGGIMRKKPPLISKDHERAYFDSADWALGKVLRSPRVLLKPFAPSCSQPSSKHGTGNLLMLLPMVKLLVIMQHPTNEDTARRSYKVCFLQPL